MKPRILVIGNACMELRMKMSYLPRIGETSYEDDFEYTPGGEGVNAAVTFAKLGFDTVLCARQGGDSIGQRMKTYYESLGIDTRFIVWDNSNKTGLYITIDESRPGGVRRIKYQAANELLEKSDVEAAFSCYPDAVYLQLDIPEDVAVYATELAEDIGVPVFIDCCMPERSIRLERLKSVEIFSPNEQEICAYTSIMPIDIERCLKACMALEQRVNAKYYVIKIGERGVFLYDGRYYKVISSYDVDVKDATAAGSAFTAAMVTEYLESQDIKKACEFGNITGALTVTRKGAAVSIPTADEIAEFIVENEIEL